VKRLTGKKLEGKQFCVTPREKEVVHLLAYGLSSRKIAEEMGISFHTVESFRKKLLQKFKAKTTVEMVLKAGNVLPREFWINQATGE
jgi:DNA-binding CsgD family transcriptional regulator